MNPYAGRNQFKNVSLVLLGLCGSKEGMLQREVGQTLRMRKYEYQSLTGWIVQRGNSVGTVQYGYLRETKTKQWYASATERGGGGCGGG